MWSSAGKMRLFAEVLGKLVSFVVFVFFGEINVKF